MGMSWSRDSEELEHALEVRTVHELHHDEMCATTLPDIEDLHALRVAQVGAEPCLVEEHIDELAIGRELRENALDRHLLPKALHAGTLSSIHLGHSAGRDALDHLIALLVHGTAA